MIKGVKRIIAVLGLVLLSSLVFVACDDQDYETTSISFRETEKIVMVVGDEYSPIINVLPSYASNKGYHFEVMGNSTILRVESKKIVALKEGVAQLKVIADANEYLNDVISVNVLREPIKLDTPTALRFDGELISFAPVENATSYNLFVNNEKIELQGRTSVVFDHLAEKISKIHDTILNIKVQAVGDSKITIPSQISNEISVLKISAPTNLHIKDNILSFDKVAGVNEYLLNIYQNDKVVLPLQMKSTDFAENVCMVDMASYIDYLVGGEYSCELICSKNNYTTFPNVEIFSSNKVEYVFDSLSTPNNFKMSNNVLFWDKVVGADYYTLWDDKSVVEKKITTNQFDLLSKLENGKTYTYKLVACSNNENIVSNLKFSEEIVFSVLTNPDVRINIADKLVEWDEIENAVAYRVVEKKNGKVVNSYLTTDLKVNVADFSFGEYEIEVTACGNGTTVLTAQNCNKTSFVAQDVVKNVRVENMSILWDINENSKVNLSITDPSNVEVKNEVLTTNSFDLSGFVLDAGEYRYSIQYLAKDNALSSKLVSGTFHKLEEITELKLQNGTFSFQVDFKTVDTKVECYKSNDKTQTIAITKNKINEYVFDTDNLADGEYTLVAYAYGNKKDIFDANNIDKTLTFVKLNSPTIDVDTVNRTITLSSEIAGATKYELFQNGEKVAEFDLSNKSYSVNDLPTGNFEYSIKSVGDGESYVDSKISAVQKKVSRLTAPQLTFDKTTKKFAIKTEQQDLVDNYVFTLDGENIPVVNMSVDCSSSSYFQSPKIYTARVYLDSKTSFGEYDLLLDSNEISLDITKINPAATVQLDNGIIKITPNNFSADENYTVDLKIGYKVGEDYAYVDYNQIPLAENSYSVKIMDENYNFVGVVKDGQPLFDLSNNFKLKWTVKNTDQMTLDSDEIELASITKRDQVTNIVRANNQIAFSASAGASEYLLSITTDTVYYVSIHSTSIDINTLVEKFSEVGLVLNQGTFYNMKVVALGEDNSLVLSSVSDEAFSFKILDNPTASITLNEIQEKVIELPCNIAGVESFDLAFVDRNNQQFNINLVVGNQPVIEFPLSNVFGLSDGEISVKIKAKNASNNYFDSQEISLAFTALATPTILIKDGVLVWQLDNNALNYTLYYNNSNWQTKTLTISDFDVVDGEAHYVLKDYESGLCQVKIKAVSKLQVDGTYYFDSQDSDVLNVLKLSKPTVSIVNGEINIAINSEELEYVDKLLIKNLQTNKEINVVDLVENISNNMTILPEKLIDYLGVNNIATEKFTLLIFAKNKSEELDKYLLNSEILTCEFAGLKTVKNIHIETSVNYDDDGETIDKIVWSNNTNNQGLTKGYVVEINFYKTETDQPIKHTHNIEGENICMYTFPMVEGFGAGTYKIKVKTLASDSTLYVNSAFSEEYVFTLANTPTNFKTENGKITWDNVSGAGHYLVRVFDKNDNYLSCLKVKESTFDFYAMSGEYAPDLYKISVQAINENDPNIVSSAISTEFLVVKLPAISKYKLDMGKLYVYVHSFASKVKLTLTSENKVYNYECDIISSIGELSGTDWNDIADLSTILTSENETDTHKFAYQPITLKLTAEQLTQIIDCLNDGYTISLQTLGNSAKVFATVDGNVTNSASGNSLINANYTNDEGNIQRQLIKAKMPTVNIVSKGVVSWNLLDTEYANMNYNGLQNILLYNITISVKGKEYSFLVADNVDINNLPSGTTFVKFEELDTHTYYGYLRFDNGTTDIHDDLFINVIRYIDGQQYGELNLDFTKENIHYVEQSANVLGDVKVSTINIISGGNFDVAVNLVGDSTIYLTSNSAKSKTIIRYQQLTLAVDDGYLTWNNLKTDIDSPIYLVRVVNTETSDTKYVYLYEENMGDNFVMPIDVEGATFKQAISYDDDYITFMLDTIFGEDYIFDSAIFNIDVTTYCRDNTSLATLQSKPSPTYKINKLKQITLSLHQGNLSWTQTVVNSSSTMIYDYEITAKFDGQEIVFRISQQDYKLENNTISYNLPIDVTCINGEIYTFQEGSSYVFTVKALAMNNTSYVNSNNARQIATSISSGVTNLAINDNVVSWDYDTDGKYRLELTYEADGSLIRYIKETTEKSFELPSTIIDTTGQGRVLSSNYIYSIKVMRLGSSSVISSFYSTALNVEKLKTLTASEVTSNQGVLEWNTTTNLDGEDIADTSYELVFEGEVYKDGQLVTNEIVNGYSFDFALYNPGVIKFYIVTHHKDYFKSEKSSLFTFYKLDTIEFFEPIKDSNDVLNTLVWNSVKYDDKYADAYLLEVYSQDDDQNALYSAEIQPDDITADKISFNLASLGVDIANMRVRIKAITKLDSSVLINGEWSSFYSLSKANEVASETFKINGLYVEWQQIEGEQNNDSYILQYFYKEDSISISNEERIKIEIGDTNSYRLVTDGEISYKVYYYKLYKIGLYTNIRITVNRTGSMSSNPVVMSVAQEDGSILPVEYNFDLYASGEGSEQSPYIINTITQFKNIDKYSTSNFMLGQTIDLTGETCNLVKEFSGVFDGNNLSIIHWNPNITTEYLGIFEQTNNATIKNLTLAYVNARINAQYLGKAIYGGLLTGRAVNTVFNNITINQANMNINITDYQNSYTGANSNFYFGGIAGYLSNSSIENINVSLQGENNQTASIIAISGQTRDKIYFGGVAGCVLNSNIQGNATKNSSVTLLYSAKVSIGDGCTTIPNVYIGGIAGCMNNTQTTQGIKYISVTMTQVVYSENGSDHNAEILNQAGVCAMIDGGCIQNVVVSGDIGANEFSTKFNSINLGKIVANYNKDVVKYILDNNVENMILTYREDGRVNIVEI